MLEAVLRTRLAARRVETRLFSSSSASFASAFIHDAFQEGDRVFLRRINDPDSSPILTPPLRLDRKVESHFGVIPHEDIIGKSPRNLVASSQGSRFRLAHPTLAEYCVNTPRLVTPIYPGEANIIVSLLDVHVELPKATDRRAPLEILEAGTGHGSLTLHLARAIHAANPWRPKQTSETVAPPTDASSSRRAIIHTLDISERHSKHAKKIVAGFRHGLYSDHVDFHVGTVPDFIRKQTELRGSKEPFLSCVVLDMPGVHNVVANVASAIHPDGRLALYCPSITQILDALKLIERERLPFFLDSVVELGANTSAGKTWDVRLVKPRERRPAARPKKAEMPGLFARVWKAIRGDLDSGGQDDAPTDELLAICRPKLGGRITAGGFLGIWKRIRD